MNLEGVPVQYTEDPCPPASAFRFLDGRTARSLREFYDVLGDVPPHVLAFHRTHFPAWIADVLGDRPLAERVRSYGDANMDTEELRRDLRTLVLRRIAEIRDGSKPRRSLSTMRRKLTERFRSRREP